MKIPQQNQDERLDKWLLIFSIIGVLLFAFLLSDYSSLFKFNNSTKGLQLGSVSQLSRDVRRRATEDFVWLPLTQKETVYVGDSIFTGPKSSVSIKLDSGVKLWIDPDSLVVLEQSDNLTKLDLKFGNLRGNLSKYKGSQLKLNVNNQDMDLEGQSVEFSLEKKKLKNTNLRVTEGQARLTDVKTKKKLNIAKKHHIDIGRDVASINRLAVIDEEPIFVRTDQWSVNKNLWFSEKQKINFSWQTEGPVNHFRLVASKKPDLSQPFINEKLKINGFEWNPSFDEDNIFWRVEVFKNEKASTPSLQSDVIHWKIGLLLAPEWVNHSSPLILSPKSWEKPENNKNSDEKAGQPLIQSLAQPFTQPALEWRSPIKAVLYRFEISKDPLFKTKEKFESKNNKLEISKLEIGQYYARVRSENIGRPPSLWSQTLIIEVTDTDPDGLVEPLLLTKEIETQIGIEKPLLKWDFQPNTKEFLVEKSTQPNFEILVKSTNIKNSNLFTDTIGEKFGSYYFRIYPLSKSGRKGPVSKTIIWNIRPGGPIWNYKDHLLSISIPRDNKDEQLLPFPDTLVNWSPWSLIVKKTKSVKENSKQVTELNLKKIFSEPIKYYLESSTDSEFSKIEKVELKKPGAILKGLQVGNYFYRVRAVYQVDVKDNLLNYFIKKVDKSNNTSQIEIISLASKVLKVDILEAPKDGLLSPRITSTLSHGVLNGDLQASAILKWDKLSNASKYKIQISEDSRFSSIVFEKMAVQNQTELMLKKSGQYSIRVAGVSSKNRVGPWSASSPWKVNLGSLQLDPVDTLVVSLPKASTPMPPGLFPIQWRTPIEVNHFQVEVSETQDFNKLKVKEIIKSKKYQLKIEDPGKYFLRIKGLNQQGTVITTDSNIEAVKYIVNKPLLSPELILPKDKVSYILSKIENPEVWLEWDGDKLSNQYVIEFSKDRGFKKVLYTLRPKEKRVLLDHASIRGKVFWRVKGLNEDQGLESPWSAPRSLSVVDIESDD